MNANARKVVFRGTALLGLSTLGMMAAMPTMAQSIVNGSFENNGSGVFTATPITFPGWNALKTYGGITPQVDVVSNGTAEDGSQYVTLNNGTNTVTGSGTHMRQNLGNYGIEQKLDLNFGQQYQVTYFIRADAADAAKTSKDKLTVVFGSGTASTGTTEKFNMGAGSTAIGTSWTKETIDFTYTGKGSDAVVNLDFKGGGRGHGMNLDNVSIAAVPEFGSILGLGGLVAAGGFAGFRRRKRQK